MCSVVHQNQIHTSGLVKLSLIRSPLRHLGCGWRKGIGNEDGDPDDRVRADAGADESDLIVLYKKSWDVRFGVRANGSE